MTTRRSKRNRIDQKCSLLSKHIDEIADFLSISPSYLLRGIEDGPEDGTKAAVENEMLRVFRKSSTKKQEFVIRVAQRL